MIKHGDNCALHDQKQGALLYNLRNIGCALQTLGILLALVA